MPGDAELRDVFDSANHPDAITLDSVIGVAHQLQLQDLVIDMNDRKSRRSLPHYKGEGSNLKLNS